MLYKKIYLTSLPIFFLFTVTVPGQFDPSEEFKKEAIKQSGLIFGKQASDTIDHLKEKYDILKPSEKLAIENLELTNKNNGLQNELLALQIKEAKLGLLIKKVETAKVTLPNDQYKTDIFKQYKQEFKELNGDSSETENHSPEIQQPNQQQQDPNKINETKVKTGLFAAIAGSFYIAATAAGKCADSLASYSFAYITENSRLKDTFIGKHATGINRTLVAATIIATTYAAYSLYKSKTPADDDDDIFSDDNDF